MPVAVSSVTPARPGTAWSRRARAATSTSWRRARACPQRAVAARMRAPGAQPRREASQPTSSSAAAAESGRWRTVTPLIWPQRRAPGAAGRRSRRSARARASSAATRGRRRRPARTARATRSSAAAPSGSSTESSSTTWARSQQRVDRLGVAVGRPHDRRQLGHQDRVDDRVAGAAGAAARCRSRPARAERDLARAAGSTSQPMRRPARRASCDPARPRTRIVRDGVVAARPARRRLAISPRHSRSTMATRLSTRAGT